MNKVSNVLLMALLLLLPGRAVAQNYRIVDESLDDEGHGYTVVHVWGSHHEMGYALGYAMAEEVAVTIEEVRTDWATLYPVARVLAASLHWPAPGHAEEMDGFVDGVLAAVPDADIDGTDVRAVNALTDLPYVALCRTHSAWGRYVEDPVRTLSTRRLDYNADIDAMYHHMIVAMDPDDGPQWLNFGWLSMLAVVTGVNEHGTVVALHDLGTGSVALSQPVPRSGAARAILTGMGDLAVDEHTAWAAEQLGEMQVMTDTFIPYLVPEGLGGFFTCESQVCELVRPQEDFLFGEAVVYTNSPTDGHSAPLGASMFEAYYDEGGPKDMESHWAIAGPSFHRVGVEYRGDADMTIWFDGDTGSGSTGRVELEWDELFDRTAVPPDGDADADADGDADASLDAGGDADGPDGGGSDAAASDSGTPEADGGGAEDGAAEDDPGLRPFSAGGGCRCEAASSPTPASLVASIVTALLG